MAGLEDDLRRRVQRMSHRHRCRGCRLTWNIPIALGFDPEILSVFREALADTSPSQPTVCSFTEEEPAQQERKDADACDTPISPATSDMLELSGIFRARIPRKDRAEDSKGARDAKMAPLWPPGGERKAVVYFTSLRSVRKTFVDCCAVRSILSSYGVRVDERDVSMHAVFKAELAELLGPAGATLPRSCDSSTFDVGRTIVL